MRVAAALLVVGVDPLGRPLAIAPEGAGPDGRAILGQVPFPVSTTTIAHVGVHPCDPPRIVAAEAPLLPEVDAGDILLLRGVAGSFSPDGLLAHPSGAVEVAAKASSRQDAADIIQEIARTTPSVLETGRQVAETASAERRYRDAAGQPDMALVAAFPDDGPSGPEVATRILKTSGRLLFGTGGETCESNMLPMPYEPGLWIIRDVEPYTEYDEDGQPAGCSMAGDLRKTTVREALETFSLTQAELDALLPRNLPPEQVSGFPAADAEQVAVPTAKPF
jgi:hypothetical protein